MKKAILRLVKAATLALALCLATGVAFAHEKPTPSREKIVGDYTVLLSTTPEPAVIGYTTLNILIKNSSGQIVKDANVTTEYKMDRMYGPEMSAKPNKAKVVLKGDTYQSSLKISMDGVWHITVKIVKSGKEAVLDEDIYVFPVTQY